MYLYLGWVNWMEAKRISPLINEQVRSNMFFSSLLSFFEQEAAWDWGFLGFVSEHVPNPVIWGERGPKKSPHCAKKLPSVCFVALFSIFHFFPLSWIQSSQMCVSEHIFHFYWFHLLLISIFLFVKKCFSAVVQDNFTGWVNISSVFSSYDTSCKYILCSRLRENLRIEIDFLPRFFLHVFYTAEEKYIASMRVFLFQSRGNRYLLREKSALKKKGTLYAKKRKETENISES